MSHFQCKRFWIGRATCYIEHGGYGSADLYMTPTQKWTPATVLHNWFRRPAQDIVPGMELLLYRVGEALTPEPGINAYIQETWWGSISPQVHIQETEIPPWLNGSFGFSIIAWQCPPADIASRIAAFVRDRNRKASHRFIQPR